MLLIAIWRPPGLLGLASGQVGLVTAAAAIGALTTAQPLGQIGCVMLGCLKPQVGVPLLIAMALRCRVGPAALGALSNAVVSMPVVIALARREGGLLPLVRVMRSNLRGRMQGTPTGLSSRSSRPVDIWQVASGMLATAGGRILGALLSTVAAVGLGHLLWRASRRTVGRTPEPTTILAGGLFVEALTPNEAYSLVCLLPGLLACLITSRVPPPPSRQPAWR